jgi:hypothetical protein
MSILGWSDVVTRRRRREERVTAAARAPLRRYGFTIKDDGLENFDSDSCCVIVEMSFHSGEVLDNDVLDGLKVGRRAGLAAKDTTEGLSSKRHEVEDQSEIEQLDHIGVEKSCLDTVDVNEVGGERAKIWCGRDIRPW